MEVQTQINWRNSPHNLLIKKLNAALTLDNTGVGTTDFPVLGFKHQGETKAKIYFNEGGGLFAIDAGFDNLTFYGKVDPGTSIQLAKFDDDGDFILQNSLTVGNSIAGGGIDRTGHVNFEDTLDSDYYVQFLSASVGIAANRALTFNIGNANRTFSLQGNLTVEATSVINSDLSTDANWATSGSGTFGNLTLASGSITDSSGAISFDNEDLSTTQKMIAGRFQGYGDVDTYMAMGADLYTLNAGGLEGIRITKAFGVGFVTVNNGLADVDFKVHGDTIADILKVDAGNDLLLIKATRVLDKLSFTQVDDNEYIDSLADGYMDYGATTAHRFNTPVRGTTSLWWRVQHVDLASTPALGAVGAVYTPQSANNLNGYQLDNAPSEEYIYFNTHVGTDWDAASDLEVVLQFETNVDNSGGAGTDTVNFDLLMYYKGSGETTQKTQDLDASVVVGTAAQYYHETVTFTINYDLVDHVVQVGDCVSFRLHLNTTDSEVDNVIVHHAMFRYKTNKVRAEV